MSNSSSITRWSGPASVLGAALWLLIWILFLLTHQLEPDDNKGGILTLTYYDYSKLIVIPPALFAVALGGLYFRHQARIGRLSTAGFLLGLRADRAGDRLGVLVLAGSLGLLQRGLAGACRDVGRHRDFSRDLSRCHRHQLFRHRHPPRPYLALLDSGAPHHRASDRRAPAPRDGLCGTVRPRLATCGLRAVVEA